MSKKMTNSTIKKNEDIPNGWVAIYVSEIFKYVKSYAFSREHLLNDTSNKEGIGNIHYGDIHSTFYAPSIDLRKVSVPEIRNKSFVPKTDDLLRDGDLIMVDASEDYEGVGTTVLLNGLGNKKVVGGLHTYVLRDVANKTNKEFRQYIFRNPKIRRSLQKVANGVSVYGISKKEISKLLLSIPPLPEQKRIVAVLETWDKTIELLKKKIKIKKQIKKGLMQELLTGKTRLPGFEDKWEVVQLQNICSIIMGQSPPSTAYNTTGQGFPLIQGNNDIENRKTLARIWTTEITKTAKKGDIIMTVRAPVGWIGIATEDVCIGRGVCAIRAVKVNHNYIFKLLESYENRWKSFEQGSTFTAVNSADVKALQLNIPKSKGEQTAIANTLTTADKEIVLLEQELSIIQDQKKYLLNNLITGAIRTPETL